MKRISIIVLALVLIVGLSGCSFVVGSQLPMGKLHVFDAEHKTVALYGDGELTYLIFKNKTDWWLITTKFSLTNGIPTGEQTAYVREADEFMITVFDVYYTCFNEDWGLYGNKFPKNFEEPIKSEFMNRVKPHLKALSGEGTEDLISAMRKAAIDMGLEGVNP